MEKNKIFRIVIPLVFILFSCIPTSSQQLIPFSFGGKEGYVTKAMDVVIEPQYLSAGKFSDEGYALVRLDTYNYEIIDMNGDVILHLKSPLVVHQTADAYSYSLDKGIEIIRARSKKIIATRVGSAGHASNGIISLRYYDSIYWDYIDLEGNLLFPGKLFRRAYEFQDGVAVVISESGYSGIINFDGEFVCEPNFRRLGLHFSEGLCPAQAFDKTTGYVRTDGTFAFKVPIVIANNISETGTHFNNGHAIIQTSDNPSVWRIINTKGEYVSGDISIDWSAGFSEGYALISNYTNQRLRYSYINTKGEYLIDFILDKAESFHNGYARVVQNGREGLIDTKGKIHWSDEIMARKK